MRNWILVMGLVVCGCQESPPPKVLKVEAAPTTATQNAVTEPTLKEQREAFGVLLPPEIVSVDRSDTMIVASTKLRFAEVVKFYEGKLPDYEVIEGARNRTYVPLREYSPELFVEQLSYSSPTTLFFRLKKKPLPIEEHVELKPGDPVHFKTPDGQELAPGAIYGEAYTPPPGTPLAHPRYKSNWGKPFGSWVPQ